MNKSIFKISEFFMGLLFLLAAYFCFKTPEKALVTLVVFFGAIAISRGFGLIIRFSKFKDTVGFRVPIMLISGILQIIVGIMFLFNTSIGIKTIGYVFAIWFFINSLSGLIYTDKNSFSKKSSFAINQIFNFCGVIISIVLVIFPQISAINIPIIAGIYFTIFALLSFFLCFININ